MWSSTLKPVKLVKVDASWPGYPCKLKKYIYYYRAYIQSHQLYIRLNNDTKQPETLKYLISVKNKVDSKTKQDWLIIYDHLDDNTGCFQYDL